MFVTGFAMSSSSDFRSPSVSEARRAGCIGSRSGSPNCARGIRAWPDSGQIANRPATSWTVDGLLGGEAVIEWLSGESRETAQLVSRGALPASIADKHALILGCGSLGSAVAELFKRAGMKHLTVIDGQALQVGNLCRHTLSMPDIKGNKAEALALRLNEARPHGFVDFVPRDFHRSMENSSLQRCDLVVDCTAEDSLLRELERFPWEGARRFVSLSLGYKARRLFCFIADADTFPHDAFAVAIRSWIEQERHEHGPDDFPREGIGCWHPVFPARLDDVWLMASTAVKLLDGASDRSFTTPELIVFEQQFVDEIFVGVRRAQAEATVGV